MKTKNKIMEVKTKFLIGLLIVGIVLISGCVNDSETQYPPIEPSKGRVVFDLKVVPEEIITREIVDEFLIGVGTTDFKEGCVSPSALKDLRVNGINYFLPFTQWPSIETKEGFYKGEPCPGNDFISFLNKSGAVMNGHCLIFFIDFSVPDFAVDRPFNEQKEMIEKFVKATVKRFPEIEIWTLNEPIAQNYLGWSREQAYDVFISVSKWIHEVNPEAKVMINMIPIKCDWGGLDYEPNEVLDDLIDRGLEADVIGVELYYWWAEEEVDENGYPKLDWVKSKVDIFRKYDLPIIFSEIGVPGTIEERDQFDEQADWMETLFRFFHDDEDVIGATWYFVRDDEFMPYAGLMNDNYTYRPVAERLIELANEWNPSTTYNLNGRKYLDLDPGQYDITVNQEVFRANIIEGQTVMIGAKIKWFFEK